MPRQPMAYTVPQPIEPLNIEEVRFWLDIMQDHAVFIKAGLPCDRTDLMNEAQNFIREFDTLGNRAERVQNDKKFNELLNDAYEEVREFHRFKRHLLRLKVTCKLAGCTFPLQYDHLAREAEYVMRLFDKMRQGRTALKGAAKTQENAFWVRIMGDHAKFMNHLLDPSERLLVETAHELSENFDELYLQSVDFVSMLNYSDSDAPSFGRFLQDVRTSTRQLRDFKRAVQDMIAQCKLLGLIPELLADHVRREAEHFLMILTLMEKGIINNVVADPDYEAVDVLDDVVDDVCLVDEVEVERPAEYHQDDDEDSEEDIDEEDVEEDREEIEEYCDDCKPAKFDQFKPSGHIGKDLKDDDNEEIDEDEEDDDGDYSPPPVPKVQPVAKEPQKYKWGGKWPRPLGKS